MWMPQQADARNETAVERLRREAEELDRSAELMKGCSFYGEPPWLSRQRDASDKRLLALLLEGHFPPPKDNT